MKIKISKQAMLEIINTGISKGINGIVIQNGTCESFTHVPGSWGDSDDQYELNIKESRSYDSWDR